ncbi:MAG: acetyl-CoA carboxylase biotin carboxyl carrier protein [Mangrovicoccus sp.]|nr:acetyl-CoA carboxylase biotin carboxyl carrier protein [Mangrovicoccus sp.]
MTRNSHSDDVEFIRALAELLRANDLTELEVRRDYGEDTSLNIRVTRVHPPAAAMPAMVAVPQMAAPQPGPVAAVAAPMASDPAQHPGAVTSPMVGTVYLQAEPGSEPFIRVGAQVAEGQTLLIIEAMKTMNQIPAPRAGTIARILVADGTPVEYGAPLVIIE